MKPAISITTTILGCVLAAGTASAQSPSIIQNTRATMNAVSANERAASNAALGVNESAPRAAAPAHVAPKPSGTTSAPAPARISSAAVKPATPKKREHQPRGAMVLVQQPAAAAPAAEA